MTCLLVFLLIKYILYQTQNPKILLKILLLKRNKYLGKMADSRTRTRKYQVRLEHLMGPENKELESFNS